VILVDTNVLLDLVTDDPDWAEWSLARLEEAALAPARFSSMIVYPETSIRYHRIEDLDAMLAQAMIEIALTRQSKADRCLHAALAAIAVTSERSC
jgi:predicted nucleic acid-binding protein